MDRAFDPLAMPHARRVSWAVRALLLGVVLVTCWPFLQRPQLEADDFRYLALVQQMRSNPDADLLESMIVENRWDHMWWVDVEGKARFFRPTVLLSFWMDVVLWEGGEAEDIYFGLMLTNMLVHMACCLLVLQLLLKLFGHGPPTWIGAVLFACFSAHAEVLWYPSGRTDSMAALGFLLVLALQMRAFGGGERSRFWAVPAFAFALLTKELAIAAPLIALLGELALQKENGPILRSGVVEVRRSLLLYVLYAVVVGLYLAVRFAALGSEGSGGMPYPYAIASVADLPGHVWMQVQSYLGNLFFATGTAPFATDVDIRVRNPLWMTLLSLLLIAAVVVPLRQDNRLRWSAALAVLTWLPTCFVYLSERYLYLPSFALVVLFTLVATRTLSGAKPVIGYVLLSVGVFWSVHQAAELHFKHEYFSKHTRNQTALTKHFRSLREELSAEPHRKVLMINFPGDWADTQFLQYQMRFDLDMPDLQVRVLGKVPYPPRMRDWRQVTRVEREGPNTLKLVTRGQMVDAMKTIYEGEGENATKKVIKKTFPYKTFTKGLVVEQAAMGFKVEVLEGNQEGCSAIRVTLPEPLENYHLVRFRPPGKLSWPQGEFLDGCSARIVRLARR